MLVITLTVLIAFTGWSGVEVLTERSERIAGVGRLGALTRDMLIGRLSYTINYDAEHAASWLGAIESLESYLVYIRSVLHAESDAPHLEAAAAALKKVRAFYNVIVSATGVKVSSRKFAGEQADAAADKLNDLDDYANSTEGNIAQRAETAQALSLFQKMRFDVRGYTYTLNSEAKSIATASIASTITYINSLEGFGARVSMVKQLQDSLVFYEGAITKFGIAQDEVEAAQSGIAKNVTVCFCL